MQTFSKPTPDQVNKTIPKLLKVAGQQYFFERLNNPEWLEPLHERGIFKSVPQAIYTEEGRMVRFPAWPAANYLTRMASVAPDTVSRILKEIPESDNATVQHDIIRIALQLPPNLSAKIAQRAEKWVKNISRYSLPDTIFELIKYLAEGGEVAQAFKLAEMLLKFDRVEADRFNSMDAWHYEQALKSFIPTLLKADPKHTLELICSLLRAAINAGNSEGRKPPNDYLYIARPEIAGPARYPSLENALIDALRDNSLNAVRANYLDLSKIMGSLEAAKWWIFYRISLFLLKELAPAAPEIAAERLLDRKLFDEHQCRAEYSSLLEARFNELNADQKKVITDWILSGPDLERYKRNFKENRGEEPDAGYLENFKKYWIRDRLIGMGESLPPDLVALRAQLIEELGVPESFSEVWMGPTSPKSIEELRGMGVEQIAQYLREWIPSGLQRSPSPDGMGRVLLEIIKESPIDFARNAELFIGLNPIYIGNIILGFSDAAKNSSLPFTSLIKLCEWVVARNQSQTEKEQRQTEDEDEDEDEENSWRYARQSIARLLDSALQNKNNPFSFELRDKIWPLLEALSNDPDPDDSYIPDQKGTMESVTFSLNTVRGVAMHAIIQYALWVSQNLEKTGLPNKEISFKLMPEVQNVLDYHLIVKNDPSPAIRSVYGQWLPWLALLDKEWTNAAIDRIFPEDEEYKPLWYAAWNTYIRFCSAYKEVFPLLKSKYFLAIKRIAWRFPERDHGNENLGAHLMTYYWRGNIDLSEDGLVVLFFRETTAEIRGKAMQFIGRSLLNDQRQEVPADIKQRLQELWKYRIDQAKANKGGVNFDQEIESFGLWFTAGIFEKEWSIKQLLEALSLVKSLHYTAPIITELSTYVREYPLEVAKCIKCLLLGASDNLHYLLHKDEVMSLLRSLLASNNQDAVKEATQLIHKIGEQGVLEIGKLLKVKQ